jgi:hypothetical protein
MWTERESLYKHLARTADQFWVAEQGDQMIGFARSILRDGVRQLTEIFVLPEAQSSGVGRDLFIRAFPADSDQRKNIIASLDLRAQIHYLKAGLYPRFPVYYFGRSPRRVALNTDLYIEKMVLTTDTLDMLGEIDQRIIQYRRDVDHTWFSEDRTGYLYYREGRPVGYGYAGIRSGPFALLDPEDFPAVLAHAENQAVAAGRKHFGVEVPMVNQHAVDILLARGFRIDTMMAVMMNEIPFGKFEQYLLTSPPFFI